VCRLDLFFRRPIIFLEIGHQGTLANLVAVVVNYVAVVIDLKADQCWKMTVCDHSEQLTVLISDLAVFVDFVA